MLVSSRPQALIIHDKVQLDNVAWCLFHPRLLLHLTTWLVHTCLLLLPLRTGQFAMVDSVSTSDKKISFEFIAAVPREVDTSQFEAGIAPLDFASLRVISFPGGQQYGAVSPCEMNEFSDECEAWEEENGPYVRGEFMVKSNPRTKGR